MHWLRISRTTPDESRHGLECRLKCSLITDCPLIPLLHHFSRAFLWLLVSIARSAKLWRLLVVSATLWCANFHIVLVASGSVEEEVVGEIQHLA